MIASQKLGKSFMGALNYNLKKLSHPDPAQRAELLDMSFASPDRRSILAQVALVKGLKPALSRYVYHTSLNFSKEEAGRLDNEKLLDIAHDYLNGMGFTNNQYLIFRHHDADHPHLHLLVNRIGFNGKVVTDSNNYKRSEAILRKLEKQYNLITLEHSKPVTHQQNNTVTPEHDNKAPLRAPTKSELEMVVRTGKASDKMVLQQRLNSLLSKKGITLNDFISGCEGQGINLLFNQASTGKVSGITYFYGDFKITGKALGNRFKWAEIIKQLNYEQGRDGKGISQASERTRARYGDLAQGVATAAGRLGTALQVAVIDAAELQQPAQIDAADRSQAVQTGGAVYGHGAGTDESAQIAATGIVVDQDAGRYGDPRDYAGGYIPGIEISGDIDDEAILGRNRRKQKQARTNQR